MKKKTKISIILLIALVVAVGIVYKFDLLNFNKLKGSEWYASSENLVGSSSNAVSVPRLAYFANSTTTPPTNEYSMIDGGQTIDQLVDTRGVNTVILNISAIAPTATSTLYVRQMGSHDGTNFFDIASSTSATLATTTYEQIPVHSVAIDPGTATSSASYGFNTQGYKSTRFIIWSEGWTGDLDTGVQAWIQAVKVEALN